MDNLRLDQSYDDLNYEEEIECFALRKSSEIKATPNLISIRDPKVLYAPNSGLSPALICDIIKGNRAKDSPSKKYVLFARVIEQLRDNYLSRDYLIDDNTASVEMRIRHPNDSKQILRLENELQALKTISTVQSKPSKVLDCLLRVLTKIKQNFEKISIGQKILVFGKPSIFRGKMVIDALSVCKDESLIRLMEIEIKDLLVDSYAFNEINSKP